MVARHMAPGAILASLLGVWLVVWLSSYPQPQPPLRVATTPWIGYQPLVLAEDLGQFPQDAIRLVELSSNTESLRALRNWDVERPPSPSTRPCCCPPRGMTQP